MNLFTVEVVNSQAKIVVSSPNCWAADMGPNPGVMHWVQGGA